MKLNYTLSSLNTKSKLIKWIETRNETLIYICTYSHKLRELERQNALKISGLVESNDAVLFEIAAAKKELKRNL